MSLPVHGHAEEIVAALAAGRRLVLAAPTGSGKTTQVPQILWRAREKLEAAGWRRDGRIVVLQPRRLATRLVAARVAAEMGQPLGGLVGYQTRHDQAISRATRLAFLTEGLFLRQVLASPSQPDVSCAVLDEFHERTADADLLLGLLNRLQATSRPDLRLAVMSATLDIAGLERFLECRAVVVAGRSHPVEIVHLRAPSAAPPWELAAGAAADALERSEGDVLVFMPGAYEIERTIRALRRLPAAREVDLRPLHGGLPPREQDAAVSPGPRRKVVVATNVAETSLTIENVRTVVDSGLARQARHDVARGLNALRVGPISQASAEQRAGRAGRVAPGRCLRLWTEADHLQRSQRDLPEVRRIELSPVLLTLAALGFRAAQFPWLDPPPAEALAAGEALLRRLGAVDDRGAITALGRRMARFPVHPRLARFLVAAAERGCLGRAAAWAALASERDIVESADLTTLLSWLPEGAPASDLLVREAALAEAERRRFDPAWCREHGLSAMACREASRAAAQLRQGARALGPPTDGDHEALIRALLPSFAEGLAVKLDTQRPHAAMPGRRSVTLGRSSVVRRPGPLLALEVNEIGRGERAEVVLGLATELTEELLRAELGELCTTVVEDRWNPALRATEQMERRVLRLPEGELELGRTVRTGASAQDRAGAAASLVERIVSGDLRLSRWDEAVEQWMRRARLVARLFPERKLLAYDEEDVRVILHEIVGDATRFSAVQDRPCLEAVRDALSWEDRRFVEQMAPETLPLPSGRRLRIEYLEQGPPIGRARIQELYGLTETPRIAAGRQVVLLEILAPNFRPVQRTTDLAGFWKTLYPELRKELRRRYPRHEWR